MDRTRTDDKTNYGRRAAIFVPVITETNVISGREKERERGRRGGVARSGENDGGSFEGSPDLLFSFLIL